MLVGLTEESKSLEFEFSLGIDLLLRSLLLPRVAIFEVGFKHEGEKDMDSEGRMPLLSEAGCHC